MGVEAATIEPPIPHAVAGHTRATNPRPLDGGVYRRLFADALG